MAGRVLDRHCDRPSCAIALGWRNRPPVARAPLDRQSAQADGADRTGGHGNRADGAGRRRAVIRRRSLLATLLASVGSAASWSVRKPALAAHPGRPSTTPGPDPEALWKTDYARTRVWGYVDKHSIRPGESFNLMLSTGPGLDRIKGKVRISRVGYTPSGLWDVVWESEELTIEFADQIQVTSAIVGAAWGSSYEVDETEDWRSGYYTIDFVDSV